jgi:hypothetical protein
VNTKRRGKGSIGVDGEVYDLTGSPVGIIHRTVLRGRKAAIVDVENSMHRMGVCFCVVKMGGGCKVVSGNEGRGWFY